MAMDLSIYDEISIAVIRKLSGYNLDLYSEENKTYIAVLSKQIYDYLMEFDQVHNVLNDPDRGLMSRLIRNVIALLLDPKTYTPDVPVRDLCTESNLSAVFARAYKKAVNNVSRNNELNK